MRAAKGLFLGMFLAWLLIVIPGTWVFVKDYIPRHRTWFKDYAAFREKANMYGLPKDIPEAAEDEKYYWGVAYYAYVAGYGICLPEADYQKLKAETIDRYISESEKLASPNEILYTFSEDAEPIKVQKDWLQDYQIPESERLTLRDESIEDYYLLSYRYIGSNISILINCTMCNDANHRVIEMVLKDMDPPAEGYGKQNN